MASGRTEIIRAKLLHDLGLAVAHDLAEPLAPFDRLIQRLHLNHRPAAQELLQLDERPIGHGELPLREPEPRSLRIEGPRRDEGSSPHRLPDERPHLGHELRRWGRRSLWLVVGIVDHELHVHSSLMAGSRTIRWAWPGSADWAVQ